NLSKARSQFYSAQLAYENSTDLVKGTEFSVDAASFNLASLSDNLDAADSKYQQAENDLNRIEQMFQKGAATKQAYENAQTQLDLAKSQVASAHHMIAA